MKKITSNYLEKLLQEEESSYLDFKKEHHENTVKLIHDILCLANAETNSDRFIIFGVNNRKELVGFSKSRRKQAEITDCLRAANINRMPEFLLYTVELNDVELDILHIKNTPFKPYFLLKDKSSIEKTIIRAGVIYCRDNDSNTPISNTASEIQISKMWQERFGINDKPLERALSYIHDIPGWSASNDYEFYYEIFPEFRLCWTSDAPQEFFYEHWKDKKYPCSLGNMKINLLYHSTLLKSFNAINLSYKAFFPVPRYYDLNTVREDGKAYIIRKHIDTFACAIISGIKDLNYYDREFIIEGNIKEPLDVYIYSMRNELIIHSLNIKIEDENINQHYSYKDF
ncbi:MAG: ATP-binding protein [Nanoarchaeota archaeon]|nr:ATP-binding protein [Nanoarchaeota archaeon]